MLAGLLAACSSESYPDVPSGSTHLFDQAPLRVELDPYRLSPAIATLLSNDVVRVTGERIPVANMRYVPLGPDALKYRVHPTRFPAAGGSRIVAWDAADATGPEAEKTTRLPQAGEMRVAVDGVTLGRGRFVTIAETLDVDYHARPADVLEAFLTRPNAPGDRLLLAECDFADDTRRGYAETAGSRVTWTVSLGQGARLRVGCALRPEALQVQRADVHVAPLVDGDTLMFRVEVDGEAVAATSLSAATAGRVHDLEVDFAGWAGSREGVELSLVIEGELGGDSLLSGVWLEPTLSHPFPTSTPNDNAQGPPNVIVLLLDTLRADRLGCYGWERARTPELDALAERGVRFSEASSAAPWTLPSHASLFASLYPSEHALWKNTQRLTERAETFAELLRERGYVSAAFSEGGYVRPAYGFAQGFDRFVVGGHDAAGTFDAALAFASSAPQPFLLFAQTYQVHSPYEPPSEQRAQLVRPYDGELGERVHPPEFDWGRPHLENTLGADDARYISDLYDAEIAYLDTQVGRLLAGLDAEGLLRNTLLIVTSDHGEELADHGHFGHGFSLYAEQLHVPLIVYQPGVFDGGLVIDTPVHGLDIAPTIARAAGAEEPASWRGRALPMTGEPAGPPRDIVVPHFVRDHGDRALSVRRGDQKFIDYPPIGRPSDAASGPRVYDLTQDPGEQSGTWGAAGTESGPLGPEGWTSFAESFWSEHPELAPTGVAGTSSELRQDLKDLGYAGDD